jgi:hypothetical protein
MSIDGSLVLNIALGIVVAKALLKILKNFEWMVPHQKVVPAGEEQEGTAEDWLELWESLPESAKGQLQRLVEDDQLRRRAQELKLWPFLWAAAPEKTKAKLRSRWKAAKIQSSKTAVSK